MLPTQAKNLDVLIVGGGVIGLSLAYELACRGQRVGVIDHLAFGRESSWAGAGIIPPGSGYHANPALESLAILGHQLLPEWSRRLWVETGIDNGWRVVGGIYLTCQTTDSVKADVENTIAGWREHGIRCHAVSRMDLKELEAAAADCELVQRGEDSDHSLGWYVPDEAQIRNPRHLRALVAACKARGVALMPNSPVRGFDVQRARITRVVTDQGEFSPGQVCLTAGCWTGRLAAELDCELPIRPIRGQIVLLREPSGMPPLLRHVHWADRYAVPRDDGRVLIGATVEDVGFRRDTTEAGVDDLMNYARRIGLGNLPVEKTWAGLRPATPDGLPLIGRLPNVENGWVATGHFRAGLQMAASTSLVMADLLAGKSPPFDVSTFAVERCAA